MLYSSKKSSPVNIGYVTGICLVVANMIGTGIFTTPGFVIQNLSSPLASLCIWMVGGVAALCGALTYAELGCSMPRSGGEYHYLSQLYHPGVGFLSGWVSLFVGFSAPIAAASVAFGEYVHQVFPQLPIFSYALSIVVLFSLIHILDLQWGSWVQNSLSILKVALILGLIVIGLHYVPASDLNQFQFTSSNFSSFLAPSFAVSLIFVMYTYSGWNAAAYITGAFRNPQKMLPASLIGGTVVVLLLYLGMNLLYLSVPHPSQTNGEIEIAYYTARQLFGAPIGQWVSLFIAFILISTISAMTMAGPRVYNALGEDHQFFRFLSQKSPQKTPVTSILLQMAIAIVLIITFTFEAILYYAGFTLSLFAGLTVFGIFIKRKKWGAPVQGYRVWGYPLTPVVFLLVSGWMVVHTFIEKPVEACTGLATLAIGILVYFLTGNRELQR